jgi:hypothetical protein
MQRAYAKRKPLMRRARPSVAWVLIYETVSGDAPHIRLLENRGSPRRTTVL